MEDTVALKLTRAEANALDALAQNSAEKLFMVVDGDRDYHFEGWDKATAASACDKLRELVLGQPSAGPWSDRLRTFSEEKWAMPTRPKENDSGGTLRQAHEALVQATKSALITWTDANANRGNHGTITLALLELGIERHLDRFPEEKSAVELVAGVLLKVVQGRLSAS